MAFFVSPENLNQEYKDGTCKKTDSSIAQDLAGKAVLFEIGAQAGLLEFIESEEEISVSFLSDRLDIKPDFLQMYLEILESLGLLSQQNSPNLIETIYIKTPLYKTEKNKVGYLAWGMISCAPLIANTRAFTSNVDAAMHLYPRCGEHVARTSQWIGEKDCYPYAEDIIKKLQPKKMVDLGSGTCNFLMRLAQKIPELTGVGIDVSADACHKAEADLKKLNLDNRIKVVTSSIQSLLQNTEILLDADIINAGFVLHDLLPDEEDTLVALLSCINTTAPKATFILMDAIPFSMEPYERAFSGAFSFLHKFFMGRSLQPEAFWVSKLNSSGFNNVQVEALGVSGARLFVAKNV